MGDDERQLRPDPRLGGGDRRGGRRSSTTSRRGSEPGGAARARRGAGAGGWPSGPPTWPRRTRRCGPRSPSAAGRAGRTSCSGGWSTSQEEERGRIARELHDQMGQHLTALRLGLKAVERTQPPDAAPARRAAAAAGADRQIGRDVHRIAWSCGPTALDDLGLPTALANYVEEWSGHVAGRGRFPEHRAGGRPARRRQVETAAVPGRAGGADQRRASTPGPSGVSLILERRAGPRARHRRGRRRRVRRRDGAAAAAERRAGPARDAGAGRAGRRGADDRVAPRAGHDGLRPRPARRRSGR